MKAIIYIDGFNLYMSRLKYNRQLRWLNLGKLATSLVEKDTPEATIERINYYTAYVSGKIDPAAVGKQQTYLAALKTIPNLAIHPGNFVIGEKWVKVKHPPLSKPDGYPWEEPYPEFIKAFIPQEKGSDVKLGVHLVRDAFTNAFDRAYVLTGDTDLVEPIRIVTQELGKEVVIVPPDKPRPSSIPIIAPTLVKASTGQLFIEDDDLVASQFPDLVPRPRQKTLTKPVDWVVKV